MAVEAISEQQLVTITIPAEYVEDFRSALVAEIKSDGEWFEAQYNELREAREPQRVATSRADRDGALACLLEDVGLLQQLPGVVADVAVSSSASALLHTIERVARQWAAQLAEELDYGPANFEAVPALLDRLRWTIERVTTIEAVA